MSVLGEQQIFRLQISVHNSVSMKITKHGNDLAYIELCNTGRKFSFVPQIRKQLSAADVFKQHIQTFIVTMSPITEKNNTIDFKVLYIAL